MSFSTPTITHSFLSSPTGTAAGVIEFSLLDEMTNGTVTLLPPAIVKAPLDANGALSQGITANTDPGTEPTSPWYANWRVDFQITGAQAQSYVITVPAVLVETSGTVLSSALNVIELSAVSGYNLVVGQSVTGTGVPSNTIISSIDVTAGAPGKVTVSNNVASGTGQTFTFGSTIDLGYLLPTVPQPL